MSADYIKVPTTGQKVYEGAIVVLLRLPDTRWVLHCGYYEYNGVRRKGWYFSSIPSTTIMPVFVEDLVAMRIISNGDEPITPCPPPFPPFPPGPFPPVPPPPLPVIFTPEDKKMIERSMITVPSLEDRDALSSKGLIDGKIVRVNDYEGKVDYFEWDGSNDTWVPATLGYRYMTRDEVEEAITSETSTGIVSIEYSDSKGALVLTTKGGETSEKPLTGVANNPIFEDLHLSIPVYGKETLHIDIPKDVTITDLKVEKSHQFSPGVYRPALVLTYNKNEEKLEVVADASNVYNLFDRVGSTDTLTIFIDSEHSELKANVKISTYASNALRVDETGLLVDISGKVDKQDISRDYVLVADGNGGFTYAGSGITIKSMGKLEDYGDTELVTANIISAGIQAAIEAAQQDIEERLEKVEREIEEIKSNLVGEGLPEEVVISTHTGVTRSGYTIGGSTLSTESSKLAREDAVVDAMSWKSIS